MDLADLQWFLAVTRHGTLDGAAQEVHRTASSLSRSIRRLESSLRTPLFDRSGRALRLNADGERLREHALALVDIAERTRAEFHADRGRILCRVAAPAVLQWAHAAVLQQATSALGAGASLQLNLAFEDDALRQVARGEVDIALVTGEAVETGAQRHLADALSRESIGELPMQLAIGDRHALLAAAPARRRVRAAQVLDHDFAAPAHSLFCGAQRGRLADGWKDDVLPRRIRYWADDVQVLVTWVKSGAALAYLPRFVLRQHALKALSVVDCPFRCTETVYLVWRPAAAHGWLMRFVNQVTRRSATPPVQLP